MCGSGILKSLCSFGGFLGLCAVLAAAIQVAWIYKVEAKIENAFCAHMLRSWKWDTSSYTINNLSSFSKSLNNQLPDDVCWMLWVGRLLWDCRAGFFHAFAIVFKIMTSVSFLNSWCCCSVCERMGSVEAVGRRWHQGLAAGEDRSPWCLTAASRPGKIKFTGVH